MLNPRKVNYEQHAQHSSYCQVYTKSNQPKSTTKIQSGHKHIYNRPTNVIRTQRPINPSQEKYLHGTEIGVADIRKVNRPVFPDRLKAFSPQVTLQVPPYLRVCRSRGGCSGGTGSGSSQGLDSSASLFGSYDDKCSLSRGSVVLVDLEGSDTPVGVTESARVVLDECLTAAGLRRTSRVLAPDVTGPVATESVVKGESLVLEETKVAGAFEGGCRDAPASRVGVGALNITRLGAVAPKPDFDKLVGEFGCIRSTTVVVELCAIGISTVGCSTTTCISWLSWSIDVAVRGNSARLCASGLLVHIAACTGVKGHAVGVLVVDTFDDVDLTLVGPVIAS